MLPPGDFANQLLKEAQDTHPWLHHPLFRLIIIEKNELFALQRAGTIEARCGGNIATESINATHVGQMALALEKHYGLPRSALEFYYVHAHVEEDHRDRAVRILEQLCVTDAAQKAGLLAMRRAITARRTCVDGLMEAFVTHRG